MANKLDVLITNTTIVDGTGKPAVKGNIAIRGEKIVAVGDVDGEANRRIDATGRITCPGFVDPHSHADLTILQYPLAENFVMQGVTTFVGGNCGMSLAPIRNGESYSGVTLSTNLRKKPDQVDWNSFGDWLSRVEKEGISINYAPLVGHSAIRTAVMGADFKRRATAQEIELMKKQVEEAMQRGAFGISSSFDPGPGEYSSYDEIIELAKIAQKYGGFYTPHTRHHQDSWITDDQDSYGYGLMHGYKGEILVGRYHGLVESIEIARQANIRLVFAHLTPAYLIPQPQPEILQAAAAEATLIDIIDKPIETGLDVFFTVIAYTPSIGMPVNILDSFFHRGLSRPDWMEGIKKEDFVDQLQFEEFRTKVKAWFYSGNFKFFMVHPVINPYWMDSFMVIRCKNTSYEGKTIGEIARKRSPDHITYAVYDTSIETVLDIIAGDPEATWGFVYDVRENPGALPVFLQHPRGMPCIDSFCMPNNSDEAGLDTHPPIAYGLYPHYIRTFVIEKKVLSLEEAIRKATFLPARTVLGLENRGVIEEGAYADIVIFDYEKIGMSGDFLKPASPPSGIDYVMVNGNVVYENMHHTGVKAGKVLRLRS